MKRNRKQKVSDDEKREARKQKGHVTPNEILEQRVSPTASGTLNKCDQHQGIFPFL